MEDEREGGAPASGIGRGQNQLHVLPEDWELGMAVIAPLLERFTEGDAQTRLLVLASDPEAAVAIATRVSNGARGTRTVAATETRRAERALRAGPAPIVVGTPATLVALLQSATLKLAELRAVVLAWLDVAESRQTAALETLMTEVPKEAARIVLASAVTPEVEQLVERYARRARRVQPAEVEAGATSLRYLAVHDVARPGALRRLVDALDPASVRVAVRSDDARLAAAAVLTSLGFDGPASVGRLGEPSDTPADLVVLYDVPASTEELRATAQSATTVVALVAPRQLAALKRMAGGGSSPLALPEAAARARDREDRLRDELRTVLSAGQFGRELLALEPLLTEFDGVELAAAALRLLDAERAKAPAAAAAASAQPAAMKRLYVNIGAMDNVRPADLVGAITNETGVARGDVGRVDIRERHSTVEVAAASAETVISRLTGVTVRGRRVIARLDEGGGRERRDRDRPPRRDDVRLGGRERGRGGPGRGAPGRSRDA